MACIVLGASARGRHVGRLPDRRSPARRSCTCSSAPPAGGSRSEEVARRARRHRGRGDGTCSAPLGPRGVELVDASTSDGRPLRGQDLRAGRRGGEFLSSTWSSLSRKGHTLRAGSGWQQVEREAFASCSPSAASVPVLQVVAASETPEGDGVLVLDADARRWRSLEAGRDRGSRDRGALARVRGARAAGVALGRVTGNECVRSGGRLGGGRRLQRRDDGRGREPVCWRIGRNCWPSRRWRWGASAPCGSPRARWATKRSKPRCPTCSARPWTPRSGTQVKERDWELEELRVMAEQETGSAPKELEQLRRVTWGSIAEARPDRVGRLRADLGGVERRPRHDRRRSSRARTKRWVLAALLLDSARAGSAGVLDDRGQQVPAAILSRR